MLELLSLVTSPAAKVRRRESSVVSTIKTTTRYFLPITIMIITITTTITTKITIKIT